MDESVHILIVDDDRAMCETLSDILVEDGYVISTASEGRQALQLSQEHFYNLALVDLNLPDTNGIAVLQQLREMSPRTAVIIITAYSTLKNAVDALSQGADAYITKPIDLDEVRAIIRKELHTQQVVEEKVALERERRLIEYKTRELKETLEASESMGDMSIRKLKDLSRYNESILESMSSGIVVTDLSGKITKFNRAAEEITGFKAEEVLGKIVDRIDEWKGNLGQRTEGAPSGSGDLSEREGQIVRRSGERTQLKIITSALRSANDEITGVISVFRDISRVKELETKLSAVRDFSRRISVLLNLDDVLSLTLKVVQNVLGHEHCAIHFIDPESNELHNQVQVGFTSNSTEALRIPLHDETRVAARAARKGNSILIPDFEADSSVVPTMEWARSGLAVPLKVGDEVLGVLEAEAPQLEAFSRDDITVLSVLASYVAIAIKNSLLFGDLARAKEELEQWNLHLESKVRERTQELQDAQKQLLNAERMATIGELAGSFAHELRNPLGVLQNSAYYLSSTLRYSNTKIERHLSTMKEQISRAENIISSLLDFSRANEPSLRKIDLNEQIEEALSTASIPEGVEVITRLDSTTTLAADPSQIQTTLRNLICNAVQAMPTGGRLTLETATAEDLVQVRISDTGVGIPEDQLATVFRPLFTTKSWGLGIGLTVAKKFVEGHGGTLGVQSTPKTGSTFTVTLPLRKTCEPVEEEVARKKPEWTNTE